MGRLNSAVKLHFIALFTAFLLLISNGAIAAPTFPQLTGRVVDGANILTPAVKQQLETQLAQIETEASDQLVVVTLNSLQGYEIEEYGYQLGRAWGIGQAKLNNGVLLIVAPNERKVRIEVGYGLEGVLTDALSNQIITQRIIPQFKAGNMQQGIVDGVAGIDEIIKLSPEERADRAAKAAAQTSQTSSSGGGVPIIVIIFIIFWIITVIQSSRRNRFRRGSGYDDGVNILPIIFHDWDNDDKGGGGFGGGGFGGGFGGGGGGFGGGGSSGSW